MQNLLNPRWLFIVNTLPVTVLFFLFYGEYQIIKSLLEEENLIFWKIFGWTLGLLTAANISYGILLIVKRQKVPVLYGLIALLCYTPYVYLYSFYADSVIPWSIPQWMIPGNLNLYVGTFLMPTLAYALLIIVVHFTPKKSGQSVAKNFVIAIAIPIAWYVFAQVIFPLWQPVGYKFRMHATFVVGIVTTLFFLFFLIRSIYILATKKAQSWKKYQLFWKIPITIILPLIGLAINSGDLKSIFTYRNTDGIFGDFGHYSFFLLAIINGILLCLPNLGNKPYRLLLFIGRTITFAYTFYFFIVFLPLLPFSVAAIVAFGIGFLLLAPIMLMVLHSIELSNDFTFLINHFSRNKLRVIAVSSFLVIPIFLTLNYLSDKRSLNQALEYVYSPDYTQKYDINKNALYKTLGVISHHKSRGNFGFFGKGQPYLSSYYNWLVLDNLSLSRSKAMMLEGIFNGKTTNQFSGDILPNEEVEITNISSRSTYDETQDAWKSWIDLEITNNNETRSNNEYSTTLELPVGAWISDYYLYVGDRKEMGILSEKKAAMWVFSNIVSRNRDPGILHYLTGNKVAFRVFPFAKSEVRRTGFELLHKEPIEFSIDNKTIVLGDSTHMNEKGFENENYVFVSASKKEKLEEVKREPYLHFVVDASSKKMVDDYTKRIELFSQKYKSLLPNAKISFVNTYVSTYDFEKDWKNVYANQTFEGGFYTERAFKKIAYNTYQENSAKYPIIVTVSEGLNNAIFSKDLADWQFAFPETDLFYNLTVSGEISSHSLISQPLRTKQDSVELSVNHTVLKYRFKDRSVRYLKKDGQASIILKKDHFEIDVAEIKEKKWESGLSMHTKWISQVIHPEIADDIWLDQVKYSFLSRVMSPVTSYLVVENESQKAILKKKQQEVLSGNRKLDLNDDSRSMSEPGLILLSLSLILVLWIRNRRQGKRKAMEGTKL